MYAEMACGSCDATFSCDAEEDGHRLWDFIHRFASAHVACGYMTPASADDSETDLQTANIPLRGSHKRKISKKKLLSEDDDE